MSQLQQLAQGPLRAGERPASDSHCLYGLGLGDGDAADSAASFSFFLSARLAFRAS